VIHWLNPAALIGLTLIGAPIVIHLLRMHRAERVEFPSLRFVRAAQTAAVRVRWPSDLLLLALRVAVIAASVLAIARPIVLTPSRLEAWNARIARAIVVDTSESMGRADGTARPPSSASAEASDAERSGATYVMRVDDPALGAGLRRAVAWLDTAPPARREIVVVSDFQRGSLTAADLSPVPATIGVRFVRVGDIPGSRTVPGLELLAAPGVPAPRQEIAIAPSSTRMTMTAEPSRANQPGLRITGETSERSVAILLRAVAESGAPAPSASQPISMVCSGSPSALPSVKAIAHRWMLDTVLRVRQDASLKSAAREAHSSALSPGQEWTTIAVDGGGTPIVSAAESGDELVLRVGAPADSFIAAVALSAALKARHGDASQPEQEIAVIDPVDLRSWSRAPAPVERDAWRQVEDSDGRWLWLIALLLLAVEQVVRRTSRQDEEARVAA